MMWLLRVLGAASVWGLIVAWAVLDDRDPHYIGLAAAVGAAFAVIWLWVDACSFALPPQWYVYNRRPIARSFDPRFSRLSQELAEAASRQEAAVAVHLNVAKVADQILVDKYGVVRSRDVEEAARILGPETSAYLVANPNRERDVFSPQLFDVLARLESL